MRPFAYERPDRLDEVIAILANGDARLLAGGTDLIIRLRDGTARPEVVVDVKRVTDLDAGIHESDGRLVIGGRAVMTDIAAHPVMRRSFTGLAEAASVVGSVQIRNRATLAGNIGNASPAADTVPSLLAHDATVVVRGAKGERRIAADDVFVRSGVTTIAPDEAITAIQLPLPDEPSGSAHQRRTRRRGHDLASVTVACTIGRDGVTRLAYGSVGPRPLLRVDETGTLADAGRPEAERRALLDELLADAAPSATSMRASPDYRLAMLRILGWRAIEAARERRAGAAS
ncbi:MAG TPA: xanthine dehydrogenase family protein subunit M [Candidatus Limnocylindrales bacterium]|nr:xanthine dehydrogenase family protein subunit M [Candidatus Limnocylindrales bacterium]